MFSSTAQLTGESCGAALCSALLSLELPGIYCTLSSAAQLPGESCGAALCSALFSLGLPGIFCTEQCSEVQLSYQVRAVERLCVQLCSVWGCQVFTGLY